MKTSVIEVRDILSVLSILGVEKRIGEVPGVESVTVNYAAGSATVRRATRHRGPVARDATVVMSFGVSGSAPAVVDTLGVTAPLAPRPRSP